mgnify:CR=1 FL=1
MFSPIRDIISSKPSEEVEFLTEELLKQDYYYALLLYASHIQDETGKELERYHALLPEINGLYHKGILSALFRFAATYRIYDQIFCGILTA